MSFAARGRKTRGRLVLIGIAALFIFPVVLAWWLTGLPVSFDIALSEGSHLISGVPTISEAGLTGQGFPASGSVPSTADKDTSSPDFRGHWSLLAFNQGSSCRLSCTRVLYVTRQVREALGRERYRVRRFMITSDGSKAGVARPVAPLGAYVRGERGLSLLRASPEWLERFRRAIGVSGRSGEAEPFRLETLVIVLDPEARAVLFHPVEEKPRGLIKDLSRLLKLSKRD